MESSLPLAPATPLEDIVMVYWDWSHGPTDSGEIVVKKYDDLAGTWKALPDFYQNFEDAGAIEQDHDDA